MTPLTENNQPLLLPPPRRLTRESGVFDLSQGGIIHLGGNRPADLLFTATQLQKRLAETTRQACSLSVPASRPGIVFWGAPTMPWPILLTRLKMG
jgi:hypothetical protein